jgi:2-dehydropantoate 2-reductase
MQRDIRAGKNSEMDGLIFQVVRMGDEYGVELPTYRKIARAFGYDC